MSKVYFVKSHEIEKIKDLLPEFNESLGVKVHFGEAGNTTYLPARYVKTITAMVKNPTLIECSVLYKSPRRTAAGHKQVALDHGFDFAPIDFLDGPEGDDNLVVDINGPHCKMCYLGEGLQKYRSLLVISHFKGHGGAGFGGALKTIGMGLASRRGKLAQHASVPHKVNEDKCIGCGTCVSKCPVNAISLNSSNKAHIDERICISCSKCISVCPQSAIGIPWGSSGGQDLQEKIAEYALAASRHRQCFHINFLVNITSDCDCCGWSMEKLTEDIGILVSNDPVAIDQASYDMVVDRYPDFKPHNGEYQLAHAAKIGLGSREYELISV